MLAIKLESSTGHLISSVNFNSSTKNQHNSLEVNGLFAVKQGFSNNQEVVLTVLNAVPSCTCVYVEPVSADDWEIISLNSSLLEENILNQVRIVAMGQILPVWVQGSVCLFIKVVKIEPCFEFACLVEHTEVIVSPFVRNEKLTAVVPNNDSKSTTTTVTSSSSSSSSLLKSSSKITPSSSSSSSVDPIKHDSLSTECNNGDNNDGGGDNGDDDSYKSSNGFMQTSFNYIREKSLKYFIPSYFKTDNSANSKTSNSVNTKPPHFQSSCLKFNKKIKCRVLSLERFLDVNGDFAKKNCVMFENVVDKNFDKGVEDSKLNPEKSSSKGGSSFSQKYHCHPFSVYISRKYFEKFIKRDIYPQKFLSLLVKMSFPNDGSQKQQSSYIPRSAADRPVSEETKISESNFVEKLVVTVNLLSEDEYDQHIKKPFHNFIFIPKHLRYLLNLQINDQIYLESLNQSATYHMENVEELFAYPINIANTGFNTEMLRESVVSYLKSLLNLRNEPILLNEISLVECFLKENDMQVWCLSFRDLSTLSSVDNSEQKNSFFCLDEVDLESIKFNFKLDFLDLPFRSNQDSDKIDQFDINYTNSININTKFLNEMLTNLDNYVEFLEDFHVKSDNSNIHLKPGNVLIHGSRGSGKTTFCKFLKSKFESQISSYHVEYINCKEFSNKPLGILKQKLTKIFNQLIYYQPSILLLDDLDGIVKYSINHDTEQSDVDRYHAKVSKLIGYFLSSLVHEGGLVITISTVDSIDSLHKSFMENHIFDEFLEMRIDSNADNGVLTFVQHQINALIRSMSGISITNSISDNLNTAKLDGYVLFDIESIVKQMVHNKLIESSNNNSANLTLTDEDVYKAISTYKPLHLRFTQLFEPPIISWNDVGGLQQVKKSLTESLLWPTTYSKLFKNYPLPLRTGVLLYGPQGTGKTLLASAVASECKLNIISVKGPELLNKFIGASEKAVRDTFKKAKDASPCIIFFDELDSLAPRRGRDSTGVTDRVVNQLLAELDGVEELEGVYILAATNRPDLIDPALLRPGRLDKLLYFPLPDADERLMILKALTRNIVLDADVDLKKLADSTENFTGADLKGLLYNALLEVVHHHHKGPNNDDNDDEEAFENSAIKVKDVHLKLALSKTQPSILGKDRRRFGEIYSQFNGSNEEIAHKSANAVGVKATFA